MSTSTQTVVRWAPRALTVLFAVLLSSFALDVFSEGGDPVRMLTAAAIHLLPALLVLALLAIAWRHELTGSVAFAALAIGYIVMMRGRFPWTTYAIIAGPLLLIAALFLASRNSRALRTD